MNELYIYFLILLLGVALGFVAHTVIDSKRKNVYHEVGTFTLNETDPARELFAIKFEDDVLKYKTDDKLVFTVVRE
jgi:hypothetical protein